MPPDGAPEPDIVVTSAPAGEGLIPLQSVRLIVEVSDSTLAIDTGTKAALYARNGVPEYWVADVAGAAVHQMSQPERGVYGQKRTVAFGQQLTSATIADLAIILPTS